MLISYLTQLERTAKKRGVRLLDAFHYAGVRDSTLSRARTGTFEMRQKTAEKVMGAIYELSQELPDVDDKETAA